MMTALRLFGAGVTELGGLRSATSLKPQSAPLLANVYEYGWSVLFSVPATVLSAPRGASLTGVTLKLSERTVESTLTPPLTGLPSSMTWKPMVAPASVPLVVLTFVGG